MKNFKNLLMTFIGIIAVELHRSCLAVVCTGLDKLRTGRKVAGMIDNSGLAEGLGNVGIVLVCDGIDIALGPSVMRANMSLSSRNPLIGRTASCPVIVKTLWGLNNRYSVPLAPIQECLLGSERVVDEIVLQTAVPVADIVKERNSLEVDIGSGICLVTAPEDEEIFLITSTCQWIGLIG